MTKELYKLRVHATPQIHSDKPQINPDGIFNRYLKIQEELKESQEQKAYLQKTVDNMNGLIGKLNKKNDDLEAENEKVLTLYRTC